MQLLSNFKIWKKIKETKMMTFQVRFLVINSVFHKMIQIWMKIKSGQITWSITVNLDKTRWPNNASTHNKKKI